MVFTSQKTTKVLKEKAAKENNTKNIKKTENTHTHTK